MVGLLFDNDGVLVDSTAFHWQAWQLLMKEESFSFMFQDFANTFGLTNDAILQKLLPDLTIEERERIAKRKEELFRQCARGKLGVMEEMKPFLREVKRANLPRIIASSTPKENLDMFLESTELGEFFDQYVSADTLKRSKPFPDIFLEAAKRIGCKPEDSIVFEDAPAGLQAARSAHTFVVALCTSHTEEELSHYDYDLIFPNPSYLKLPMILAEFELWKKRS